MSLINLLFHSIVLFVVLCGYSSFAIRSNWDLLLLENSEETVSNKSSYLVHHWPLNGNGLDIAGGAHATDQLMVAPAENRFNIPNKATMFASGYFVLPPATYFTQSDFTATVWVKVSRFSIRASIFDFATGASSNNIVFFATYATTTTPALFLYNGATYYSIVSGSATALSLNTWHHLSYVFERNVLYLYKDGVMIGTRTSTPQATNILRSKNFIGRSNWFKPGTYEDFIGVMDDLRIYHRALSATEILQVMREDD